MEAIRRIGTGRVASYKYHLSVQEAIMLRLELRVGRSTVILDDRWDGRTSHFMSLLFLGSIGGSLDATCKRSTMTRTVHLFAESTIQ